VVRVALTRLRIDELVNAWGGGRDTPRQIALLGVFDASPFLRPDDTVDVPRIRRELAARVRRVAPLGRRVVWTHPGEGRPFWVADPSFLPEDHIEHATMPRGSDLANWAANRMVRPLDVNRPLWRAEVVDGLPDARFAVIIVLHHIAADGATAVAMVGALLDQASDAVPVAPPVAAVPPLPSHRELLRERVHETGAALRRARRAATGGVARLRRGVAQYRDAIAAFRSPEPPTCLPRHVGPGRRLVIARQPLEAVQRAGDTLGATVNDLVLAAVAGGLRVLMEANGHAVDGLVLRSIVPAATGRPGQVMGMLVVALPVGEPDPLRRLARVNRATTTAKTRLHAADDVPEVLHLPVPLARAAVRTAWRFGSSRVSLSVTDVPGPTAPLWLAGARLLEAIPVAPLVPLVPVAVAALSYAGDLAVSINADAAVRDLELVGAGMERSFSEFRDLAAAGVMLPRLPTPTGSSEPRQGSKGIEQLPRHR